MESRIMIEDVFEKLKKFKWILLTLVVLVIVFLWFEVRPSIIRHSCQEWAYEMGNDYFHSDPVEEISDINEKSAMQVKYMDGAYSRCLHDKGLE